MSIASADDAQTYIRDLKKQQDDREAEFNEAVLEEAREMYDKAIAEKGHKESDALFLSIYQELTKVRAREALEKYELQDKMLEEETKRQGARRRQKVLPSEVPAGLVPSYQEYANLLDDHASLLPRILGLQDNDDKE